MNFSGIVSEKITVRAGIAALNTVRESVASSLCKPVTADFTAQHSDVRKTRATASLSGLG